MDKKRNNFHCLIDSLIRCPRSRYLVKSECRFKQLYVKRFRPIILIYLAIKRKFGGDLLQTGDCKIRMETKPRKEEVEENNDNAV